MRGRFLILVLAGCAASLIGCRGRDDLDGRRKRIAGLDPRGTEYTLPIADGQVVYDFLDNRAAAVVHEDGALVIECGTADMAKYAEGSYRTGWHLGRDGDGERAALVHGLGGELFVPLDSDPGGVLDRTLRKVSERSDVPERQDQKTLRKVSERSDVPERQDQKTLRKVSERSDVPERPDDKEARETEDETFVSLRARAAATRQLVSVFLDEKRLGDIAMNKTSWQDYRIRIPAGTLLPGEAKLRLYFRHTGTVDRITTAAAIARIRLGRAPSPSRPDARPTSKADEGQDATSHAGALDGPALRAEPVLRDGKLVASLRTRGRSRLSYYVAIPAERPALVLATAGSADELAIAISPADASVPPTRVLVSQASARFVEHRVDLARWAGKVVRVDFLASGPADWGRPQLVAATHRLIADKIPPADHVIVWVVSSLRASAIATSTDSAAYEATPAFTRLAREGIRFSHAHSVSSSPGPAHVAMLAGAPPEGSVVPASTRTLGERFSEARYTTALISGNGFVNDEAGFARGFALYHNPMRIRHPFGARVLWQKARELLRRHRDSRTFVYIVTVEPHLPYSPQPETLRALWDQAPPPFDPSETLALADAVASGRRAMTREERAFVNALYQGEVRDADAALGEMLADLDALGIRDRTAVVVVGDHGEELWERDAFGLGRHLHGEVLDVPLFIAPPRAGELGLAGRVIDRHVSLIDLYATVLDLGGIVPGPATPSTSLFDESTGDLPRPIFANLPGVERSLQLGRYKLIVPLTGPRQLYDLDSDPGERQDLFDKAPVLVRYLRNVFGIGVAYREAWTGRRWGRASNVTPAFAADHGL